MALPDDFNKIFGSTATGGITPINDVNYAKGWEFVGANPPTKNDFTYLQYIGDIKSQWLYNNNYGRLLGAPKVYTASGSYTPAANVKAIIVEIVGGGGGGGYAKSSANFNAAGGGGGAGGYSKKFIPITSQTPIPFTVGQGGAGAVVDAGPYGQTGGTTTFGTGFSATGGTAGNSAISVATSTSVGAGGPGGIGAGGDINTLGGHGQAGVSEKPSVAGATVAGGPGGSSMISGQGGPGSGGQGGATTANGNRGNDGAVIIWELS